MNSNQTRTITICYAPSDANTANKLALDLMRRGLEVWIDQPPPPGYDIDPETRAANLREGMAASDFIVILLSPAAALSPAMAGHVEYAAALGKQLVVAYRAEADLLPRLEKVLKDAPAFQLGRAEYNEGLAAMLALFGVNPAHIVNDIVSLAEADEWLPGAWEAEFTNENDTTGAGGGSKWLLKADGKAEGIVRAPSLAGLDDVIMTVDGRWQVFENRFSIEGVSRLHSEQANVMLPQNLPYLVALQVTEVARDRFKATSQAGDQVVFRKVEG
jgi:hypothetical protein